MKKQLLSCLFLLCLLTTQVFAQDRTVSGRVTDPETGGGLPGISVFVKGTTTGTTTDVDGKYSLSAPANATLVFQGVGFATQEVTVGTQASVDIRMEIGTTDLDQVVVVAYGEQSKKEITGSVASVTSQQFKNQPVIGLDQALQGRVAGVQVTQNSGTPGSGIAVRVRGSSSINASNEPLYVVDGVPINTGSYSSIGVGNQQTSALNDINPNDIESMEILKDASAASLYGSRAANGVVLITTKSGTSGKTKISFNYYGGFQETWKRANTISGAQSVELLRDMITNRYGVLQANGFYTTPALGTGTTAWESPAHISAYFLGPQTGAAVNANGRFAVVEPNPFPVNLAGIRTLSIFENPNTAASTDWQDQIFRTAPINSYELSAQGGNEKTNFYVSGSYFDQKGIIKGSGFSRLSGLIKLDNQISKKIKIGSKLSVTRSVNSRINNDNNIFGVLSAAILTASDIPVFRTDGTYGRDPNSSVDNPLAQALEPENTAVNTRMLANLYAQYEITKGLTFKTSWSVDYLYFREDRFIPTTTAQGAGSNGAGDANTAQDVNWLSENTLAYRKTFAENHNFGVLIGASFQESRFSDTDASATSFPGNDIRTLNAGAIRTFASSSATSWALGSYFARFNYDFKGKYLLTLAVRADNSSRFSEDNRVGYFPSVSVGWRIIDEAFMDNVKFLSELKLRASYGVTGNQEIGNFNYQSLFGAGANYLQAAGLAPIQLANDNLKWETTNQLDIGLDFGLFNKVNITLDYYIKQTEDLLFNIPIPATSGYPNYLRNIGSIENRGFELGISATPISTESGFKWTSDFNISFNRNKVTKLPSDVPPFASGFASWVQEGQPLGTFRGSVVAGIFQTQEEINALNAAVPINPATGTQFNGGRYQSANTLPGDIKFVDIDGNGFITGNDQQILGSAQPNFIGGWTNSLSYKGFDFTVFVQFVEGNKIYNNTRAFSEGMNGVFGQTDAVLNRWTPTNTNTNVPRAVWGDPNNNRRNSDRWLEDGSFVRFKNVVLGYTLPNTLTKKFLVERLRIYASAQNLFTITKYNGLDPEVNTFSGANAALGTDFLTFPQARTVTFGINIGF